MIRLADSEFGNMKKSSDWVRQPALDKMLDQLVDERGCTPAELIPYDAGQALGIQTSGEFYKKVRDWKQRRAAEHDAPTLEVPPHVQADFRVTVDRFASEAMTSFLHAVRAIGGDLNRTAMLRVADAERRAEDALAENNSLLDHWTAAEAERDAALARVADLEEELADAQRREIGIRVRLEERQALLNTVRLVTSATTALPATGSGDASAVNGDDAGGSQVGAGAAADEPEQLPATQTDQPKGGQAEMPLVNSDAASQADVAGDNPG